jgi:hypothetical protein
MTKVLTQIGDEVRELTKEELAQYKEDGIRIKKELADKATEIEAKKTAKAALLAKLGITEEEAVLLLTPVKDNEEA